MEITPGHVSYHFPIEQTFIFIVHFLHYAIHHKIATVVVTTVVIVVVVVVVVVVVIVVVVVVVVVVVAYNRPTTTHIHRLVGLEGQR